MTDTILKQMVREVRRRFDQTVREFIIANPETTYRQIATHFDLGLTKTKEIAAEAGVHRKRGRKTGNRYGGLCNDGGHAILLSPTVRGAYLQGLWPPGTKGSSRRQCGER